MKYLPNLWLDGSVVIDRLQNLSALEYVYRASSDFFFFFFSFECPVTVYAFSFACVMFMFSFDLAALREKDDTPPHIPPQFPPAAPS